MGIKNSTAFNFDYVILDYHWIVATVATTLLSLNHKHTGERMTGTNAIGDSIIGSKSWGERITGTNSLGEKISGTNTSGERMIGPNISGDSLCKNIHFCWLFDC